MIPDQDNPDDQPNIDSVRLQHRFNYIGGPYAYKNSSKEGLRLDPENLTELVLMTRPGQASRVMIAFPEDELRAGIYPQHNTALNLPQSEIPEEEDPEPQQDKLKDFEKNLELLPARSLAPYEHLSNGSSLKDSGFQRRICTMTKNRLKKIRAQFSHYSDLAFNEMLDIPQPDKRDFPVWFKSIPKQNQVIIVYLAEKIKRTNFVQVIQYNEQKQIIGVKHCGFDQGKPLVINESLIDKFGNLRQVAHLGSQGSDTWFNSVERFDDGSVSWIRTQDNVTGAAVLKPDNSIAFIENIINDSTKSAAKNLGAEKIIDGKWLGEFSLEACLASDEEPLREVFKNKIRKQIGQIVDGASIPGLDPIFWI